MIQAPAIGGGFGAVSGGFAGIRGPSIEGHLDVNINLGMDINVGSKNWI
jgi:hypothetical protein